MFSKDLCARRARCASTLALVLALTMPSVRAQDDGGVALDLDEATELALEAQPVLESLEAEIRAMRETAVAARALPDPQLRTGISDLPIDTGDAGSFTRDADTQIQIGLMQEFPRAQKRRLRGEQFEHEAQRLEAEYRLAERSIRRDAGSAWLELWRGDQGLRLARAGLREAEAQQQAVEIALKTGTATQAEFLAARQEADRLRDEVAGVEQRIAYARHALSRWIGAAAMRPVCPELADAPALPSLDSALQRVRAHPLLAVAAARLAAAQTGTDLARAAYRSDWRVELAYGYRPAFSEMLMLQVGVDLPLFTRNRQDRGLAAALAQQDAAALAIDDIGRQLMAQVRLAHHDYEWLTIRLKDYEQTLLPQSQNRIAAALAGWRSGRNALREVLDARRAALDIQKARLDLQFDRAQRSLELRYLGVLDSNTEENHE